MGAGAGVLGVGSGVKVTDGGSTLSKSSFFCRLKPGGRMAGVVAVVGRRPFCLRATMLS